MPEKTISKVNLNITLIIIKLIEIIIKIIIYK